MEHSAPPTQLKHLLACKDITAPLRVDHSNNALLLSIVLNLDQINIKNVQMEPIAMLALNQKQNAQVVSMVAVILIMLTKIQAVLLVMLAFIL